MNNDQIPIGCKTVEIFGVTRVVERIDSNGDYCLMTVQIDKETANKICGKEVFKPSQLGIEKEQTK